MAADKAHPITSLLAGAAAGIAVDVALFPLDTLKTRLQSSQGFFKAGGFRGIYAGLQSVAIGSGPGASVFFLTYHGLCQRLSSSAFGLSLPVQHMLAASAAEVASCLIRVPTENVKQKVQVGMFPNSTSAFKSLWTTGVRSFYVGFGATLLREIPFSFIQFPLYEHMKLFLRDHRLKSAAAGATSSSSAFAIAASSLASSSSSSLSSTSSSSSPSSDASSSGSPSVNELVSPLEMAVCGSAAGVVAGALTTPLDMVKTRLMLGADKDGRAYSGAWDALCRIYAEGYGKGLEARSANTSSVPPQLAGARTLFSGVSVRVTWIGMGGFVFFGAFEGMRKFIEKHTSLRVRARDIDL